MRNKIRLSLGLKFSVIIMLMSLLIGALIVVVSYQLYTQQISDRYAKQGEALANATAEVVDWDKVDDYYESLEEDDAYWATMEEMRLCARSGDAEYLFVLKPYENGCVYIYDTDETDERCELGYYMDWYEAFGEYAEDLSQGKRIAPVISNEEFGWLLSVYVPFSDSAGNFAGYLGVDYSVQHIIDEEWEFIGKLALATFVVAIAMTAVFLVLLRFFVIRPINKIAFAANHYLVESADDQEGASSITALKVRTHDELESLSESLKSMEVKIQSYIHDLEEATFRSETDSMTALLNREAFEKHVTEVIQGRPTDGYFVYMMVDLDNFKGINDTYGHKIGDEVLAACAAAIRSQFRTTDFVARMGGDEFAVFYCSPASLEDVERRAESICQAIRGLVVGGAVRVSASIGVAVADGSCAQDYQELYVAADNALYETKDRGRNGFTVRQGA